MSVALYLLLFWTLSLTWAYTKNKAKWRADKLLVIRHKTLLILFSVAKGHLEQRTLKYLYKFWQDSISSFTLQMLKSPLADFPYGQHRVGLGRAASPKSYGCERQRQREQESYHLHDASYKYGMWIPEVLELVPTGEASQGRSQDQQE